MTLLAGRSWPMGSSYESNGVNFALFSQHATRVELCLFDDTGCNETTRLELPEHTHGVWHGFLPDAKPGLVYGYRVHGPYDPNNGHRFNPHKLLLDPYAKKLLGSLTWNDANYGYIRGHADADLSFDKRDSAPYVPKCVVVKPATSSVKHAPHINKGQAPIQRPSQLDSVIYEAHVKGLSAQLTQISTKRRGTYSAAGSKAVCSYLNSLGVTALELLPVHGFIDDDFLVAQGLVNYWGYQSLSFMAPDSRYAATQDVIGEFREMVKALHKAGIEVLLDVVYNHTAEGNELGPTLSFRGIDNLSYYRLDRNPRYYINDSGTGNTLAAQNPPVLQLIMDSLRYWAGTMQVDGFRFDLASILGREDKGFDRGAGFFDAIAQDPQLADVRLIAEPWDIGPGGYQLGQYPRRWSEWNDQFRDTVRRFWNSDADVLPEFAKKLLGSSALFEWQGRSPSASINLITAHDGFTLKDLVSYAYKHNEANGENNADGHGSNHSNNYGVEGKTNDPKIKAIRMRQQRNLLCSLFLSQGTPMLLGGDERDRTQLGNNNAYCQDNKTTWIDWHDEKDARQLRQFTQRLIQFRAAQPVLRRPWYLHGDCFSLSTGLPDVSWLNGDALLMTEADWHVPGGGFVGLQLMGDAIPAEQNIAPSDTLLLLFNSGGETIQFPLNTPHVAGANWILEIDSSDAEHNNSAIANNQCCPAHSVVVLRLSA
ncbi:MAG: glycogen debranching protein GlgX [Granulosicoccus sp.]